MRWRWRRGSITLILNQIAGGEDMEEKKNGGRGDRTMASIRESSVESNRE